MEKLVSIDFEFNQVKSEKVNLVCACLYSKDIEEKYWLHNNKEEKERLAKRLEELKASGHTLLTYQAVAEARSLYSLGLDPYWFPFIDLFLEYRCLSNHNDELNYGLQLVDGKIVHTAKPPPKWQRTEEDTATGFKPTHSLAEATYKLLKIKRDTEHKDRIRDLIISDPISFNREEQKQILEYCMEDVKHLPKLHEAMVKKYKEYLSPSFNEKELFTEMLTRGRYSALTGVRESIGHPFDYEATLNFSKQVGSIIDDCQREINRLFPDIAPFEWNKKTQKFVWNQKKTKEWVQKNCDVSRWIKTEKNSISLSLEAFERFFPYRHDYPTDSFGAQMVRFLKLKQSLNGFIPGGKKNFWDAVGPDKRVRPYMNIYGSQSGRSQPPSSTYLLLKPAWQRALFQPDKGKCIVSVDYGSQEFFVSALYYDDEEMINSYLSSDVYLSYAKLIGLVPQDGTKEDYKFERDLCKATILGLSYDMSKYGLSVKLSSDLNKEFTPEEAQEQIDQFESVYTTFTDGKKAFVEDYRAIGYFKFEDGWCMWGDNDNDRSVGNVPIQGISASIMRKADELCYERGVRVVCTLHDALYAEIDYGDWAKIDVLMDCMREAFANTFPHRLREAKKIRLDPFCWGPDLPMEKEVINSKGKKEYDYESIITPKGTEVSVSGKYIDERSRTEYFKFCNYFSPREEDLL